MSHLYSVAFVGLSRELIFHSRPPHLFLFSTEAISKTQIPQASVSKVQGKQSLQPLLSNNEAKHTVGCIHQHCAFLTPVPWSQAPYPFTDERSYEAKFTQIQHLSFPQFHGAQQRAHLHMFWTDLHPAPNQWSGRVGEHRLDFLQWGSQWQLLSSRIGRTHWKVKINKIWSSR